MVVDVDWWWMVGWTERWSHSHRWWEPKARLSTVERESIRTVGEPKWRGQPTGSDTEDGIALVTGAVSRKNWKIEMIAEGH